MHQAPDFRADLGDRARSNHTALIVLLPQECSDSISTQICFWSIIGNRCLINRRGGALWYRPVSFPQTRNSKEM